MPESANALLSGGQPAPLTVLSEEEEMFRRSVRDFAREKVQPRARQMDEEAHFDPALLRELFNLGLMGIEVPEEYGGAGGTFFQSILAIEEISYADASAGVIVDVQNTLVSNIFLRWASEDLKLRYFPRLVADTLGAFALSEAGSGSDAFAMACRATETEGGFLLNGQKLWITNGNEAGLFIVFANLNPAAGYKGITAFVIEKGTPGFRVGKKEDKLGIRASSTCELLFEDCRVPRENVMGEIGKGYKIAIETLNEGRIGIGAQMSGLARAALDYAVAYAKERKQFGKTIAEFQGVQFDLARMATNVEAARLLTYNAARLKDAGLPFLKEAAMTKYFVSQIAEEVASMAIEIFGGVGFTKDYPVEKLWRDSKIGRIYEGTTNMQLLTIAKLLLS